MNLRILKKLCKRAVPILVGQYGYRLESFTVADGSEAIDAPVGMERRFVRHGFIDPGLLKGTPVIWQRVSYEYDEWDCFLPSEILSEHEFWKDWEPSAEDLEDIDACDGLVQ